MHMLMNRQEEKEEEEEENHVSSSKCALKSECADISR